jgi:ribosomal protein S18 acetylase RimI-like enzyme
MSDFLWPSTNQGRAFLEGGNAARYRGRVPVTLRVMDADEFASWLPMVRDFYAQDMAANGGLSQDEAQRKAIADTAQLFPADQPSADQFVFVIEADGEQVGELWIAERESGVGRSLWIYDVHVQEGYRGRGYGKEAMLLAEAEARRRGLARIGLNVFGGNEIARNLYRTLGYTETAIIMHKHL